MVGLLIASRMGGGPSPDERYQELNADAATQSSASLQKWEVHEPLTDEERGKLAKAATDFEGMLAIHPDAWGPHNGVGAVYAALDSWDRARPHLRFAIEHPPNSPSPEEQAVLGHAHYLYSLGLFFDNKIKEAEKEADEALKIDQSPDYLYARAQARVQLHKLEAAEADLTEALKLAPGDSRCLALLKFISNMK